MTSPRVVHVEVNGQRYPIRSTLDAGYVQELASYVDRKMKMACDSAPSTDALGLAILVALNIADEYFRARDSQNAADGSISARAGELERIVDQALALAAGPPARCRRVRRRRRCPIRTASQVSRKRARLPARFGRVDVSRSRMGPPGAPRSSA